MGVSRDSVNLAVFDSTHQTTVPDDVATHLGLRWGENPAVQRHIVWVDKAQTTEPIRLIAAIARELARYTLLNQEVLTESDSDFEFVAELLPIVCGLGIFSANATLIEDSYQMANMPWRSVTKVGNLPSRMLGYALAIFAWLRDEQRPAWACHLRPDPRSAFNAGLKHLQKTNACLCSSCRSARIDFPTSLRERLTSP